MVRCNIFIISLCVVQMLVTFAYWYLAEHAGYGESQKALASCIRVDQGTRAGASVGGRVCAALSTAWELLCRMRARVRVVTPPLLGCHRQNAEAGRSTPSAGR